MIICSRTNLRTECFYCSALQREVKAKKKGLAQDQKVTFDGRTTRDKRTEKKYPQENARGTRNTRDKSVVIVNRSSR